MAHDLLRYLVFSYVLGAICSISFAQKGDSEHPEVTIPQGHLQGRTWTTFRGRKISAFLGIPYARPPVGKLRFANPVPADRWNGTLYATKNPSQCPQPEASLTPRQNYSVVIGNEDCLYLNVYTPKIPTSSGASSTSLPVMVFIHGGGYYAWSSATNTTGPDFLLDKDIVLVTFDYRLGLLGFLSTGDGVASGNWGLKDQVLALRWVQKNIECFGGDPKQVTLFGESAGGGSVHLLTLTKSTTGLFHRYITQSGTASAPWVYRPRDAYKKYAFRLGKILNCSINTSESLIACLRTVNFVDITIAGNLYIGFSIWRLVRWGPTDEPKMEGAFLTENPNDLIASGCGQDLPWLAGVCSDEGLVLTSVFYADDNLFQEFLEDFDRNLAESLYMTYQPDSGAAMVKELKSKYLKNGLSENETELLATLTELMGDAMFTYPTYHDIQRRVKVMKSPLYLYSFEYRGVLSYSYVFGGLLLNFGVSHSDDLIYLFPNYGRFAGLNKTMSRKDDEAMSALVDLWTSFATDGAPSASALHGRKWPPWSMNESYLRIGNDSDTALEVRRGLFRDRLHLWTAFGNPSNQISRPCKTNEW